MEKTVLLLLTIGIIPVARSSRAYIRTTQELGVQALRDLSPPFPTESDQGYCFLMI